MATGYASRVTRRTSSSVVVPASTLRRPCSYIVIIPSATACFWISPEFAWLHHQAADAVRHRHDLHDRHAADEARVGAGLAAHRLEHGYFAPGLDKAAQPGFRRHFRHRPVGAPALAAERSHQALRLDADQGGGQQVVLHAHVKQAVDRARRVVGVQRRQHQVARSAPTAPRSAPSPGRGFRRS